MEKYSELFVPINLQHRCRSSDYGRGSKKGPRFRYRWHRRSTIKRASIIRKQKNFFCVLYQPMLACCFFHFFPAEGIYSSVIYLMNVTNASGILHSLTYPYLLQRKLETLIKARYGFFSSSNRCSADFLSHSIGTLWENEDRLTDR